MAARARPDAQPTAPVGAAIAGPLAADFGTSAALWLAAAAPLACNLTMLLIPAVWNIQVRARETAAATH